MDNSLRNQWLETEQIRQAIVARSAYRKGDLIGGQYRVHTVLGRGGFGIVYLVTLEGEGSVFALKTYLDEYIFDDKVKEQFEKEAIIWINLGTHPFIVQAHHVRQLDGRMFVAMDYIAEDEEGLISLHDHIVHHGSNISDRLIGTWTIEFCHGMEHARSKGVIAHRDIKPANLLVDSGALLRISDFGLVSSLASARKTKNRHAQNLHGVSLFISENKQTCGTHGYIAPEIYRAEGASPQSDIFSYGASLWQLAAGSTNPPYAVKYQGDIDRYVRDLREQQIKRSVIKIRSVYWPIIEKCLDPDPSKRFSSFEELRIATKEIMKSMRIGALDFIINKDKKSVADLVNRGASLKTLGYLKEALECYEEALSLDLNKALIHVNIGNVLSKLNKPEKALASYNSALALDRNCEVAWLNRGIFLQNENQYERAIRSLNKVLKLNPHHTLALSKKAKSYLICEQPHEALACYKSALKIAPEDPRLWTDCGEVYSGLDRPFDAIVCYDKAINAKPDYWRAWICKGRQLILAGDATEGLNWLKKLASVCSNDAGILNELGVALCAVNYYKEAIPLFDAALKLAPSESAVLYCNKGNAVFDMGNPELALSYYKESLKSDSEYVPALIRSAMVMYELNDLDAAINYYAHALKIEPRNEECWFGRGSALLTLGRNEQALQCFDNALSINPTDEQVLYNKGVALLSLERLKEAIDSFSQAVEISPEYANAWYVKAYSEKLSGLTKVAMESCKVCLRLKKGISEEQQQNVSQWISELE